MSLSSAPHQKTDAVVFSYAIDSAVDELTSYQKTTATEKKKNKDNSNKKSSTSYKVEKQCFCMAFYIIYIYTIA